MPVYVRKNGEWTLTDRAYYKPKSAPWAEVLAAYVYTQNPPDSGIYEWMAAFDRFQEVPTNVRGVSPSHTGGTLIWNAPARATHYQIRQRVGTSTTVNATYPPPNGPEGGWTQNLSYELAGLSPDIQYHYTVVARRYAVDGTAIDSKESAKATLATGHPAVHRESPGYPAGVQALVTSSKTDTWSVDNRWGQTGGDVVQGYASVAARNGYGAVAYTTAYTQLGRLFNYADVPVGGVNAADRIELLDAKINRVYRRTGGSGTPTVQAFAWKYTTSDPRTTDYTGSPGTFVAPLEGAVKDNFQIFGPATVTPRENKVLTWAKEWIKKAPVHNGMLMWRTNAGGNSTAGYNGYTILRAANTTAPEWRLVLMVRWKFDSPALLSARWTPGG